MDAVFAPIFSRHFDVVPKRFHTVHYSEGMEVLLETDWRGIHFNDANYGHATSMRNADSPYKNTLGNPIDKLNGSEPDFKLEQPTWASKLALSSAVGVDNAHGETRNYCTIEYEHCQTTSSSTCSGTKP